MAGVGLLKTLKRFKKQDIAAAAVLFLLLSELFVLGYHVQKQPFERDFQQQLRQNYLLQNVSNDTGYYRLHLYGEDFVGLSLAKYAAPYGIRLLDWTTSNIWFNDYIRFTAIAGQRDSAKMWGIASVKYVASRENLSLPHLEFVNKFEECSICDLKGSYLYRNSLFLPEAYIAKNVSLVIGDEAGSISYTLVLDQNFNASKNSIVNLPTFPESLDAYGMVLISSGSIPPDELQRLNAYVSKGGILEPRITEGASQLSYDSIKSFLAASTPVAEARIIAFEPTRVEVAATDSGLLVLSEKFYKFREWKASVNGREVEKLNANLISTGVFVDKGDVVRFDYVPIFFYYGLAITLLAVAAALALVFFERRLKLKGLN